MKLSLLKLNFPLNYNIIIIKNIFINKKYNIIIYNKTTFFKIFINKNLKINNNLNFIEYKNYCFKNNFYIINYIINSYLSNLNKYFFLKIKFKGKGYKIGFYKKKIIFYFGRSHKSIFIYKNIIIKKSIKNKYKFILIKNNWNKLKLISNKTINIKKINFFTGRGLRISRQIIVKRKGRKGSFI